MTEQINYEAEVKRVYPDAYCGNNNIFYSIYSGILGMCIGSGMTKYKAWQSAFNRLKQQGKL
jgi:hypothetical protein